MIGFGFNIKHGIIDTWEGLSSVFVVAAWSEDDMSVGKKKSVSILSKKNHEYYVHSLGETVKMCATKRIKNCKKTRIH